MPGVTKRVCYEESARWLGGQATNVPAVAEMPAP